MEEDRQRDIGVIAISRHVIAAEIELTGMAFGVAADAPMTVARRGGAEHGEVDAVGLDAAFLQRSDDLVVTAGQRDFEF